MRACVAAATADDAAIASVPSCTATTEPLPPAQSPAESRRVLPQPWARSRGSDVGGVSPGGRSHKQPPPTYLRDEKRDGLPDDALEDERADQRERLQNRRAQSRTPMWAG